MKNNLTHIFLLNMKQWDSLPLSFLHSQPSSSIFLSLSHPLSSSFSLTPSLFLLFYPSLSLSHQKKSHFFPIQAEKISVPFLLFSFFQCLLTNKSGQKGTLQYFFPRPLKRQRRMQRMQVRRGKNNNEVSMHEKAGASLFSQIFCVPQIK